jgi:catechol 2,3-dioxygenase-like protein
MIEQTTPDDITAAVLASFDRCPDERLGTLMRSLTVHLHAFVKDVGLTEEEWRRCRRAGGAAGVRSALRACGGGRGRCGLCGWAAGCAGGQRAAWPGPAG